MFISFRHSFQLVISGTPVSLDPLLEPLRHRDHHIPQILGVLQPQDPQSQMLLKLLSDMDTVGQLLPDGLPSAFTLQLNGHPFVLLGEGLAGVQMSDPLRATNLLGNSIWVRSRQSLPRQ